MPSTGLLSWSFVQKLYAQCIEDIVDSMSLESIAIIQQHLERENLIILPLDVSWTQSISVHKATTEFEECVAEFNREPTLHKFLKLFQVLQNNICFVLGKFIERLISET